MVGMEPVLFWGTLATGDNGESIFIPADISTQLLLNVFPECRQAFAKKTATNEK